MHIEDAGYERRGRGERAVLQPYAVTKVARSRERGGRCRRASACKSVWYCQTV